MNVGDKIPEILGIDQDGREIKGKRLPWSQDSALQLSEG